MDILSILLTSIAATAMMTFFSFVVSKITSHQFKEPRLLGFLLYRPGRFPDKESEEHKWGWFIHYIVGVVFIVIFVLIWAFTIISATWWSGAILGFLAGIIGVIGWKIMFAIKSTPPKIAYGKFYVQLVAAHIIFGITSGILYPIFQF